MTNSEKALMLHEEWNGKIETVAKSKVNSREDLALAYTPGVAEPCKVIAENKEAAYTYTMKANTVAVISDGSAVLGLGNIGAHAAMPVMEGKAVLFKEFGGVNAVPICLDTQDTEELIKTITYLAPNYGGINLEDISFSRISFKSNTNTPALTYDDKSFISNVLQYSSALGLFIYPGANTPAIQLPFKSISNNSEIAFCVSQTVPFCTRTSIPSS